MRRVKCKCYADHFKRSSPLFQDFFRSDGHFALVSQLPKGRADSCLAMVQTAPSQLVLMLSWDNEMSASCVFTLRQGQYLMNRAGSRSSPCVHCKWSPRLRHQRRLRHCPCTETTLGWRSRTFWLENRLRLGQSLLDVGYIDSVTAGLSK